MAGGEGFGAFGVRVGSALLFGLLVLGIVLFGEILGLGLLMAATAALGGVELGRLMPGAGRAASVFSGLASALLVLAATMGAYALGSTGALVSAVAVLALLVLGLLGWLTFSKSSSAEGAGAVALATMWVGFGLAHLVFLRGLEEGGMSLVLLTVLGVWAGDVAAYVIGIAIGRHKIAPSLSPGKSWEGFVAGVIATVAVWAGVGSVLGVPLTAIGLGLIGAVAAVAGLLGDLAESRMKRLAQVKDSGAIIPGHGGILDRFDSLILVSIVVFWISVVGSLG